MEVPSVDTTVRTFKALICFLTALVMIFILMPNIDQAITEHAADGTAWPLLLRMAMWGMFLIALVGAPMMVLMGQATVLGVAEGMSIFTVGVFITLSIFPFLEDLINTLMADTFWGFGATVGLWCAFIALDLIIPAFVILTTKEEIIS